MYLTDQEIERYYPEWSKTSDEELMALAERFGQAGYKNSDCGSLFVRYSILAYVERRTANKNAS